MFKPVKSARQIKEFSNRLKKSPTLCEMVFKDRLEREGFDFKFQKPFMFYILDFFFPAKMAIIELDGAVHEFTKDKDSERDAFCKAYGIKVIRLKNHEAPYFNFDTIRNLPDVSDEFRIKNLTAASNMHGAIMKCDTKIVKRHKFAETLFNMEVKNNSKKRARKKLERIKRFNRDI